MSTQQDSQIDTVPVSRGARLAAFALLALLALLGALALKGGVMAWTARPSLMAGAAVLVPPPSESAAPVASGNETAVLAGGCFWGVQAVFQHVEGVHSAVSGYAGGEEKNARYSLIGSGTTGHAEAVRIEFDPKRISFGRILQIYFSVAHNPTELNRQGPDHGPQYRSTIFAQSSEQARAAQAYIDQLGQARVFGQPIVTTIETGKPFYVAEAYHQDYLVRHPKQPYIVHHDLPKIENLKRVFPDLYRADPVLVGAASR